ncbi:MAG: Gfo/Idh/MocA family oxidoreductase [Paenibacillaceae bacterium]|nr:Gfo/Idh/MocA family oxidoreductase [Paenibacillaceae bacterium]
MSTLKIGVIGAGSIAKQHMEAYKRNPLVELYAVCDANEQRAREKAASYGAKHAVADYRELLALTELDAVSICTWNRTHAPIAIAALDAGKHVLVEKPLCTTVAEALAIEEAVRRSCRLLQVGFVRRYADTTSIVKSFLDAGELGPIYYAKASNLRRLGNPGGWFSDSTRSGGGPLIDLGVHLIDLCWYLMGRPRVKSISGNTYRRLGNRANVRHLGFYKAADYDPGVNDVEDMANALIRFANGASLAIDVSFTLHGKKDESYIKLFGEKGGAEVAPDFTIVTERHDTILNITPQFDASATDYQAAFNNEIDHFVACALEGRESLSPVQDGVEIMKILCGIYESAAIGKEIVFDI